MNKKGFTLIELLAVIVILGIIVLLITPKVNQTVDDSRKNISYENTSRLVRSLEEYYARMIIKNDFYGCSYDFDSGLNTCNDFSFDGDKPSGAVSLSSNGNISGSISFNGYSFNILNSEISYIED